MPNIDAYPVGHAPLCPTYKNANYDSAKYIVRATVDEVALLHKKVDAVDRKVDAVYKELLAHRNDTELHSSQRKRSLKRVA